MKKSVLTGAALLAASGAALAQAPTNAELYEIIQAQQTQIEDLEADDRSQTFASNYSRTNIGGYGELHYNNIKDGDDEIDFHRFVLFISHDFNENLRFFSEFELEHSIAGEGKNGEIELEQAYIEYDINDSLQAKGGLFLVPVGIINETHEPPAFYGVERNNVEKNIIPATWWEAGAAINGYNENGLSWDFAVHSGLNINIDGDGTAAADASCTAVGLATGNGCSTTIRGGRQKVSEANANDPATTARVRYTGVNGLNIAATVQYQSDVAQGDDPAGDASAVLIQAHAIYQVGNTTLTGLYAAWDIDSATFEAAGANEQTGYYLEAAQKVSETVGLFARFEEWDNKAGDTAESADNQQTIGINYWPHENVVLKADIFIQEDLATNVEKEGFNLGIGYQF